MSDPPTPRPRRGWREPIEAGLYRPHRRACPASLDRQPRRRCACPYELQVPDGRGGSRTVTVTGLTLRQARAERGRLVASPPAPPIGAGTLTDFTVAYFRAKAPVLAAATIRNRDEDYRLRIAPTLGALALTALTREVVEGWFAELVATHPGRRRAVQQSLATLRVLLATAEAWGRIPGPNPAARLRLPPPDPDERPAVRRVLTAAQVRALYAACGSPRVETLARVAVEGGLRRGELIGLRWPDLDLPARRLMVARQVTQEQAPDGPARVVGPTKGRRARLVALSPPTVAALAAWYAQAVVEGGADASGFVWPGRDGQAMHNRSPGRAIERAQVRAGLVERAGAPADRPARLSPHLREPQPVGGGPTAGRRRPARALQPDDHGPGLCPPRRARRPRPGRGGLRRPPRPRDRRGRRSHGQRHGRGRGPLRPRALRAV